LVIRPLTTLALCRERENLPDVLAIFLTSPLDVPLLSGFQKQFETNFIAKVFWGAHGKLFECHRKQKNEKLPTKMPL